VTSSSEGDSSPTVQTFSYDNGGSLLTKGDCSFTMSGWLLESMSTSNNSTYRQFAYSADGNLTEKKNGAGESVSKMTYDSQGRLIEVDGTTFIYDHAGHLLKSTTADSVITYYVSEYYEETIDSGLTSKTTYLLHGSGRYGSYTTKSHQDTKKLDTEVLYYHHDHLGSTVAVSDSTGQLATTYTYDSHGGVTVYGQDISRYKFSGKEKFGTLYYFGARFFDSEVRKSESLWPAV
jgi:YD repeat-containing protein